MTAIATAGNKPVGFAALGVTIGTTMKNALRAIQRGQMVRALTQMSDEHLAELGLTRSDIPAHAEKLLRGDA